MDQIFIDANIFLEIFLKDEKSNECKKLLKDLEEQNTQAFTTDFIIYSCVLQVQNKLKDTKFVKSAVVFFNSLQNLKLLRPSFEEFYIAANIMQSKKLDFDDSLVVASMKKNNIKKLASLDKHFDRIKDIDKIPI